METSTIDPGQTTSSTSKRSRDSSWQKLTSPLQVLLRVSRACARSWQQRFMAADCKQISYNSKAMRAMTHDELAESQY
eukprot:4387716-Pleurochrysis_carterae.AAC.1